MRMRVLWARLEEFQALVSWNKELERVRRGVARKVREFIRKEYTSVGRRVRAKRKVAAQQFPGTMVWVWRNMAWAFSLIPTTGCTARALSCDLVLYYTSH